jgi:hypothetical protein
MRSGSIGGSRAFAPSLPNRGSTDGVPTPDRAGSVWLPQSSGFTPAIRFPDSTAQTDGAASTTISATTVWAVVGCALALALALILLIAFFVRRSEQQSISTASDDEMNEASMPTHWDTDTLGTDLQDDMWEFENPISDQEAICFEVDATEIVALGRE